MEFLDSYFEDEVREGFYIPDMMKRAWAAQAEVLLIIQDICKKNHIRYFAEWGTLLGTIRHGGRIPWDDDVDVCMLREDYNKFRKAAKKDLPEECWFMDNQVADGFENTVSLLINSRYHIVQEKYLDKYHGCPYVESVDVFCLDFVPTDEEEAARHRHRLRVLYALLDKLKQGMGTSAEELEFYLKKTEEEHNMKFNRNKPIRPQLYDLIEKVCMTYNSSNAKEVSNIPVWLEDPYYHMPAELFAEGVVVPYDTIDIVVPSAYDELLSRKYSPGWMTPVRSGGSHVYPVYSKQERFLREQKAAEFFEFKFSQEEYDEVEASRLPKEDLKSRVNEILPLFPEAHTEIRRLLYDGRWDAALNVMAECQEVAVQLGTMMEEELGEGHIIVSQLEQYCEMLFYINQNLIEVDDEHVEEMLQSISKELHTSEMNLSTCVEQGIKGKKEVVFVPYKASLWKTMQKYWREAMDDPDTEVYVIPAPYFYKDAFGKMKSEEPQYECEGYPDEVAFTSYEEYNFEVHHPECIIIQCPYDEYNYSMSIHPFFYAKNLKKYTEKLIYIPAYKMDEVGPTEERLRKTVKSYVNMPGVVFADQVIVQSEQMRETYIELLTEFAGEDTKQLWEEKIVEDSSIYVQEETAKSDIDVPEEWLPFLKKEDGSWKKVILYGTSAGVLYRYGMKVVDKMKSVFETFQKNRDEVVVLWRPDAWSEAILQKSKKDVWEAYCNLKEKFEKEQYGIVDRGRDAQKAVLLCDAYYGDGSPIGNACRARGKAVMIQNVDV